MGPTACHSAANKETATSPSPPARLASGGNRTRTSPARPAATACKSMAITSARSSCSASPAKRRHPPNHKVSNERKSLELTPHQAGGRLFDWLNVFGLVSVLTFAVLAFLQIAQVVALAGLVLGIALGVVAGLRTDKALKGFFQD